MYIKLVQKLWYQNNISHVGMPIKDTTVQIYNTYYLTSTNRNGGYAHIHVHTA